MKSIKMYGLKIKDINSQFWKLGKESQYQENTVEEKIKIEAN